MVVRDKHHKLFRQHGKQWKKETRMIKCTKTAIKPMSKSKIDPNKNRHTTHKVNHRQEWWEGVTSSANNNKIHMARTNTKRNMDNTRNTHNTTVHPNDWRLKINTRKTHRYRQIGKSWRKAGKGIINRLEHVILECKRFPIKKGQQEQNQNVLKTY